MTVEEEDTHRNIIREGVDFMIESLCLLIELLYEVCVNCAISAPALVALINSTSSTIALEHMSL